MQNNVAARVSRRVIELSYWSGKAYMQVLAAITERSFGLYFYFGGN